MEMTMKPDDLVTREEFNKVIKELRAEKNVSGHQRDDVVRRSEFQLLLWMGAFALTAMLGGFTFLYTELADLRVTMKEEHAELRTEFITEINKVNGALRADISSEISSLRADIAALSERTARVETFLADSSPGKQAH